MKKLAGDARRPGGGALERSGGLLSYADLSLNPDQGSKFVYCRKNGRVFQLKPNSDKPCPFTGCSGRLMRQWLN